MKNNIIIIALILTIFIISTYSGRIAINQPLDNDHPDNIISTPLIDQVQTRTPTPGKEISSDLLIDNISRDLKEFNKMGWNKLYVSNEFDCSRMTTYMWDYFRTRYKIPPKIIVAPEREHAWLAIRVRDAGNTDRYLNWTIKGIDYYFIESTAPEVVTFEKDVYFGDTLYSSNAEFYTTRILMAVDPTDVNTLTGSWSTEFRLTKPDIDKLGGFKGN